MFETSRPNGAGDRRFRRARRRGPSANSLTADFSRLIPNYTDVAVFKRAAVDDPQLRDHRQRDPLSQPRRHARRARPAQRPPHGRAGAGGDRGRWRRRRPAGGRRPALRRPARPDARRPAAGARPRRCSRRCCSCFAWLAWRAARRRRPLATAAVVAGAGRSRRSSASSASRLVGLLRPGEFWRAHPAGDLARRSMRPRSPPAPLALLWSRPADRARPAADRLLAGLPAARRRPQPRRAGRGDLLPGAAAASPARRCSRGAWERPAGARSPGPRCS